MFGVAEIHPMVLATAIVSVSVMAILRALSVLRRGEGCRRRWRGWAEATLLRASRDPRVATLLVVVVAIIPALLQLIMAAETAKAMGVALRLVG